jgi:XTP/dITP diphosphohydrolase
VHSARFAALDDGRKGNSSDAENNAKLLRLLFDAPAGKRTARFRCVLSLTPILHGESPAAMAAATEFFDGTCEGRLLEATSGAGGFGYDPLFIPDGFDRTFAELGPEVKNRLSHRARALAALRGRLNGMKI